MSKKKSKQASLSTTREQKGYESAFVVPLSTQWQEAGPGRDAMWLWCSECERFFQAKHLRIDFLNNRQGCAFCKAAGFDVAIHAWDTWKNPHERWPEQASDLTHGLQLQRDPGETPVERISTFFAWPLPIDDLISADSANKNPN